MCPGSDLTRPTRTHRRICRNFKNCRRQTLVTPHLRHSACTLLHVNLVVRKIYRVVVGPIGRAVSSFVLYSPGTVLGCASNMSHDKLGNELACGWFNTLVIAFRFICVMMTNFNWAQDEINAIGHRISSKVKDCIHKIFSNNCWIHIERL